MKFTILQSGSAGNCSLISEGNTHILIDCGISYKQIIFKLNKLGLAISDISAVLITHEHVDHIKSVDYIDPRIIYCSKGTLKTHTNIVNPYEVFSIGSLNVIPLPTSHDCINGVGYLLMSDKESLVYITDTGVVRKPIYKYIEDADYYIIESNHNKEMLLNTSRPYSLKRRIMSTKGHLSNIECGEILSKVIGTHTKSVVLAHISGQANTKELALKEVQETLALNGVCCKNIKFIAADRHEMTLGD